MKRGHTYYLEDELVRRIRAVAKKLRRSESFIISEVLEKNLKEVEKQKK